MNSNELQDQLSSHRSRLVAYVARRINDADLAEDILQDSLFKTIKSAPDLREDESVIPWFYRVLNNAIIDQYRKDDRLARREEEYAQSQILVLTEEDRSAVCECFKELMPSMKPEYAEVLEALDLKEEAPEVVSERLGITRANLKVRAHRARMQLKERLVQTCQMCAEHGCLNCTCTP